MGGAYFIREKKEKSIKLSNFSWVNTESTVHLEDANTVMHRLPRGIRSEKCVVKRLSRCANVRECTYTNLDSTAYYTPRLYGIAYCS